MNGFVKMGRCLFFVLLLISSTVSKGQIYKYIGLEDGLNNQKIYHIQKDQRGYMWFLTQEGIDRYDGKHIKHYNFSDDSMKLDSRIALNWLYMDSENVFIFQPSININSHISSFKFVEYCKEELEFQQPLNM